MRSLTFLAVISCSFILAGCGDEKPSQEEALQLGKQEMSMALCGDKSASCFTTQGEKVKISEKKNNDTYNASVTFQRLKSNGNDLAYDQGVAFFEIDAKSKESYVKSIEAWSEDGQHSVKLCGHNYKFCRK